MRVQIIYHLCYIIADRTRLLIWTTRKFSYCVSHVLVELVSAAHTSGPGTPHTSAPPGPSEEKHVCGRPAQRRERAKRSPRATSLSSLSRAPASQRGEARLRPTRARLVDSTPRARGCSPRSGPGWLLTPSILLEVHQLPPSHRTPAEAPRTARTLRDMLTNHMTVCATKQTMATASPNLPMVSAASPSFTCGTAVHLEPPQRAEVNHVRRGSMCRSGRLACQCHGICKAPPVPSRV